MGIITEKDIVDGKGVDQVLKEKREKARAFLEETGRLPDYWELGIRVNEHLAPQRYDSPQQYFNHGMDYFKFCVEREDQFPTLSGLVLWMGYSSKSAFEAHARRNPDFRDAHATLMTLVALPLEQALTLTGVNTSGVLFRLKNVPEGMLPTDDMASPMRYSWKDRKSTELTGADGAPILVQENKASPEETYLAMLRAGARLAPEEEELRSEEEAA
jgi:hypothetical protein